MGPTTKLRLAAWGTTLAILGMGLGLGAANTALDSATCDSRPNVITVAYGLCR